jgi:hypothetical protein
MGAIFVAVPVMRRMSAFAALLLVAAAPALAEPGEPAPPARVGAVRSISGNLAFRQTGESQWSAVTTNYPVAEGGAFWTDASSRAEIRIGPTTIGMAGGSDLEVIRLDEQAAQIGLPQGRLCLDLGRRGGGESFEIDIPQGAVSLVDPGFYDIDAGTADQPARLAVFAGSARFSGGGTDLPLGSGHRAVLSGSSPVAAVVEPTGPDAFADWCRGRADRENRLAAVSYVSPAMTGYDDLDRYGSWQSSVDYGEVWYPSQTAADWVPYSDGSWRWVAPWGWTWVDAEPWGFAPFHYGRWAWIGGRWGWVPGTFVANPVYAPALVAFVGGAGFGLGVGPAVGWFPLAPGEVYWPSYTRNVYYIRNINVSNVRNIDTVVSRSNGAVPRQPVPVPLANRRFATIVPERAFARGERIRPLPAAMSAAALAAAPVRLQPPRLAPAVTAPAPIRGPEHLRPLPAVASRPAAAQGQPGRPPVVVPGAEGSIAARPTVLRGGGAPTDHPTVGALRPAATPARAPMRLETPPPQPITTPPSRPLPPGPPHPQPRPPAENPARAEPPHPGSVAAPRPAPAHPVAPAPKNAKEHDQRD